MKSAIIPNLCEIWISLWELHTPKIYCFDVQPFKHQIPISFCKSSLWHLQHIPWNWFSIPDHVHDYFQAWVGSTCRYLACSQLQVGSKPFMDILMTVQFYSRIGNHASTLLEYWQPILQKCSYVHLMSLEYFGVSLSGQEQQIILDIVMSWDFTIASNSNVSALMVIVLTLLIKYKWSSQLFLSKMNNHPFHLWNIDQGNCLRLLILFVT